VRACVRACGGGVKSRNNATNSLLREWFLYFNGKVLVFVFFGNPIPVAARSKAWVCGRALAGIVGSNPAGAWISVSCECLCCQVEVSASG
jgi:hypothetical protein